MDKNHIINTVIKELIGEECSLTQFSCGLGLGNSWSYGND
jgi:hypothetical protein